MSTLTVGSPASVPARAALVLLATLLLHALLLEQVQRALAGIESAAPTEIAPVSARLLPPPTPAAAEPLPVPRVAPRPRPAPVVGKAPAPVAPALAEVVAQVPVEAAPPLEAEASADATAEPQAPPEAEPPPVAQVEPEEFDATGASLRAELARLPSLQAALPASARYVYRTTNSELRLASGTTTVDWTLTGDGRYRLRLATAAVGMTVLELESSGWLREFGLAPERYTETRVRRSAEAANFDWDSRRVTFSTKTHERELVDGAQDRISFQFQLMLLAQAQPERFRAGARTVLVMAGRDDVATYRFRSAGKETTVTGLGRLDAVRIERIPARESDARIDVWLVPTLGWLPVRLRFTDRLGRVTESVLESVPSS
jgi:outer membrane biosynthesis protein TonB